MKLAIGVVISLLVSLLVRGVCCLLTGVPV